MGTIEFDTYWKGSDAPERARQIAEAAGEALHTLNYATAYRAGGLQYPNHAYSMIGELRAAIGYLPQLLEQIGAFLETQRDDARLYHDAGADPQLAITEALSSLNEAARIASQFQNALSPAHNRTGHLGIELGNDIETEG